MTTLFETLSTLFETLSTLFETLSALFETLSTVFETLSALFETVGISRIQNESSEGFRSVLRKFFYRETTFPFSLRIL